MINQEPTDSDMPYSPEKDPIEATDSALSPDDLAPQELDQAADQQVIHALLQHWYGDRTAVRRNIQATFAKLQDDAMTAAPIAGRISSRWYFLSSSIAAALLIICGVWFVTNSNRPAMATVEAALRADQQILDRSYVMTMEFPATHPAGPVTRVHLDLRENKYVARLINHRGHPVVMGHNGEQPWIVLPDGQAVFRSHRMGIEDLLMEDSDVSIPFLTVENVLSRLGDNYELSLISSQRLSSDDRVSWKYLVGYRSDGAGTGPDRIEMWSHPDTGTAQKLILQWYDSAKPGQPQKVIFQRIDASVQTDAYYEPDAHTHEGVERNPRRRTTQHLMKRDSNQDGLLSLDELGPNGARLMTKFDSNEDGLLDASEIKQIQPPLRGPGRPEHSEDMPDDPSTSTEPLPPPLNSFEQE